MIYKNNFPPLSISRKKAVIRPERQITAFFYSNKRFSLFYIFSKIAKMRPFLDSVNIFCSSAKVVVAVKLLKN